MSYRHTLDPNNPHYKEGKRMAVLIDADHAIAEARVSILYISFIVYLNRRVTKCTGY